MPVRIKPDSPIQRLITVTDVDHPVTVEISATGLRFWVKGAKTCVSVSWYRAVNAGSTSLNVPSYLMGNPLELLQHQAAKKRK